MEALFRVTNNVLKLNVNDIADKAIDDLTLAQAVDLNTDSQLFEQGIDSKGESLGEYSDVTTEIKKAKGQRIDHITLKDTGKFYESFDAVKMPDAFTISADPIKEDTNLVEEFGADIIGLTSESREKLIVDDIIPKTRAVVLKEILA